MILILKNHKEDATGYNRVYRRKERDLVRVSSVLILRLPHRWWSLRLVKEEEDDVCGGGALGAPP
jgi:hypothetical protein